jgi:hypothetical protein
LLSRGEGLLEELDESSPAAELSELEVTSSVSE